MTGLSGRQKLHSVENCRSEGSLSPLWGAATVIRLQEIVRSSKSDIQVGGWHQGRVPRAEFPIAKSSYDLGRSFRWCVIKFVALDNHCRVLVVLNEPKQKFQAFLGVFADTRLRILCCHEFHAGEPGWHCHAVCGEVTKVPEGFMRGPWVRRLPHAKRTHRRLNFGVNDLDAAKRVAIDRYKIWTRGPLV